MATNKRQGHRGDSGIQGHSCGEHYPWVHTCCENPVAGWGEFYYIHPDGRQSVACRYAYGDADARHAAYELAEAFLSTMD